LGLAAGCLGVSAAEPFLIRLTRSLYVAWEFAPADPGAFLSEPWVEGDRVYVAAAHQRGFQRWGAVYALDRWTGQEIWRFDNDGAMKSVASPPRVMDGKVIVGEGLHEDTSCKLFCLDAATGSKVWEYATSSHIESGAVRFGEHVIFGAGDDGLRCVDLATGAEVWRLEGLHIDAGPTVSAGLVFVGSYAGRGPKPAPQCLVSLNALNGQVLWEEPADMSCFSPPAALDRRVFFGLGTGDAISGGQDPAGAVVVLDAVEGKWIWRADFSDGVIAGPVPLGDNVVAVSRSGEVRSLSRDRGAQRWSVMLGAPILGRPMFLRERGRPPSVLVVTTAGQCVRLDSLSGRVMASDNLVRAAGADAGSFIAGPIAVRSSIGRQIFVAGAVTTGLTESPRLLCLMEHE
jgi:outer membrane protein assembly factor BamB